MLHYLTKIYFFAGPHALPDARQPGTPGHDGGHPRAVRPRPHDQEDSHQVLQRQQQQARVGQVRSIKAVPPLIVSKFFK